MNKDTKDTLVKTVIITVALFVVSSLIGVITGIIQSEKEPYVPSYDERTDEPSDKDLITDFEFPSYTNFTIDISVGEEESGHFEVVGTDDFDLSEIEFVSSDESVAKIEFDKYSEWIGYIYYTITPISDGTATLYVQTKDGSVRSDEFTVNVTDPNNFSYEIVDTFYNIGTNSIGTLWIECFTIVENTGTSNIYLSSGSFDIELTSGKLVDTIKLVSVYPQVIAPGERAIYHESTTFDKGDLDTKYKIVPKIDVMRATVPMIRYEVSDVTLSEDRYGYINVVGRVTNHTEEEEGLCYVAIFLYNKQKEIIALDFTIISEDIAPGERASFENTFTQDSFGVDFDDVASYEIIAYSHQYQFN